MVSPSELWVFTLANVGFVLIGGSLAGLSFLAHRQDRGQRSYPIAMLGFLFVVLGGLAEAVYTLSFEPDFQLTSTEFLFLQIGEDLLIVAGLGLLFYAITQHESSASQAEAFSPTLEEEDSITSIRTFDD